MARGKNTLQHDYVVARVNFTTGKTEEIYDSPTDAAHAIGCDSSNISRAMRKEGATCYGYRWIKLVRRIFRCNRCKVSLPKDAFYYFTRKGETKKTRMTVCKECVKSRRQHK